VVFSGSVSVFDLSYFSNITATYSSETFGEISELAYTITGPATSIGSWRLTQLNPKCDVTVDLLNSVQANLGNGELFPDLIVPLRIDRLSGAFTTLEDGRRYVTYNGISARGDLVTWPRVYYEEPGNSQYVFLDGGAAPGVASPNAADLLGTMWVSNDAVRQATAGPYASILRQVVLSHEMFHMVGRVAHSQEGAWLLRVQPLSRIQEPNLFVWNGRLNNPGMHLIPQQWQPSQLAPVSTQEAGVWRSQCVTLRQDPGGYFLY
jgi:hypothetical protein